MLSNLKVGERGAMYVSCAGVGILIIGVICYCDADKDEEFTGCDLIGITLYLN